MFLGALLAFASCTKSTSSLDLPAPTTGRAFYAFARDDVRFLELMRRYPGEDPWRVVLKRDDSGWKIESAPAPVLDRLADGTFVDHWLDTLRTLTPFERAREGAAKSFGLDPPRAVLKFGASSGPGLTLEIGDESQTGIRFARFAPETAVMLTEGAAIQMLGMIQDWQSLRKRTWLTGSLDDVDVIRSGKRAYERQGLAWKAAAGRSSAADLPARLENLFHQRIKRFVDTTEETARLDERARGSKPIEITLLDRRDRPQTLQILAADDGIYGRNSTRPGTWAELHPEILQTLSFLIQSESTATKLGTK